MNEITMLPPLLFKGLLVFISTNLDDFLLLILFLAQNNTRRSNVIFGQYIGFVVIIFISLLASFSRFFISVRWLSLLGIIPIIVGIYKLRASEQSTAKIDTSASTLFVATLTIGDGWDNVSAYTPLFASETTLHIVILIGLFLFLLGAWCYIGHKVAQFVTIQKIVQKGKSFVPLVYILLGVLIIATHGNFLPPFSLRRKDSSRAV